MTDHEQGRKDHDQPEGASRVDLNAASEEELCQLPGIGPALAARIVDYRSQVRPFEEPSEIAAVPGITQAMYEVMADRLAVAISAGVEPVAALWPESDAELDEPTWEADWEASATHLEPDIPDLTDAGETVPDDDSDYEVLAVQREGAEPPVDSADPAPPDEMHDQEPTREEQDPGERGKITEEPPVIAYTSSPQGAHWGRLFAFALAGAVFGAILALAFLLMVNNTLNFQMGFSKALNSETLRLDEQIGELSVDLSQLRGRVDVLQDLSMRLEEAQTDFGQLGRDVGRMQSQVELLQEEMTLVQDGLATLTDNMSAVDKDVITLQGQVDGLSGHLDAVRSQVDTLSQESQRFGAFLAGLRELLSQPIEPQTDAAPVSPLPSTPTSRPTSVLRPQITVIPLATPAP